MADVAFGSFSTEAANSAARPRSASIQKLTSGADEKLVAMGHEQKSAGLWPSRVPTVLSSREGSGAVFLKR